MTGRAAEAEIHFFELDFSAGAGLYAEAPLFFEGAPLEGPGAFVSAAAAGDMGPSAGDGGPVRREFLRVLGARRGFDPALVCGCSQIHSRTVAEADRAAPDSRPEADGLLTGDPEVSLAVTVADCLPVYLYDTESGCRALLHSGWRGTGIVLEALRLMALRGTRAGAVAALLGPCIGPCCYGVDEERARSFEAEFGGTGPLGAPVRREKGLPGGAEFSLDLQAANARLLANAGLRNITVCRNCTFTDRRLGSFRREGAASYTRMLAVFGGSGGKPRPAAP